MAINSKIKFILPIPDGSWLKTARTLSMYVQDKWLEVGTMMPFKSSHFILKQSSRKQYWFSSCYH